MTKKVVIGLSGGVDSSVAAYLLKEQGYEVIGLFMVNWHDTTGLLAGDCPAEHDELLAKLVAKKLDIPFHKVDFSEAYRNRVVNYMFNEYEQGRTPNPDVLCNREIKFDPFIKKAEELGADYFATGHYCRKETTIVDGSPVYHLLAGKDNNKDQSYFLCQLSQHQLAKVLFPIGHLNKPEVREIALKLGLATATRKDSQGICFVGKVDLPTFLQQKLKAIKGEIVEIADDDKIVAPKAITSPLTEEELKRLSTPPALETANYQVVGEHQGAHFFTIGQRKGLQVGGKAEPLFVIGTDIKENRVYVGMGKKHPGLFRNALFIKKEEIHWLNPTMKMHNGETRNYLVRIRYRQPLQKATLYQVENGIYILFEEPQRGIASGQFAAWYKEEELLGSGVIHL